MLLFAVLPVVFGIKAIATGSLPVGESVAALVVGVAVAVLFVRRQLRLEHPLLDLSLFRRSRVSIVLLTLIGAGIAMAGVGLTITQYLQSVLGHSPLEAAALFAPMGLGVAAATMLTPVLVRYVSEQTAISGGLGLAAVGAAMLLLVPGADGTATAIVAITVLAFGTGPLFALGIGYVVGSAPAGRAGAAASLSETGNYLGGALGMALMGTLGAVVYRGHMSEVGSAQARETIGGAFAAAADLPAAAAARLLDVADAAFTSSVHAVGAVRAVLVVVMAVATSRITAPAPTADLVVAA